MWAKQAIKVHINEQMNKLIDDQQTHKAGKQNKKQSIESSI